jgi:hypothetical protein
VADEEILELYRQRIDCWLGPNLPEVREQLQHLGQPYLPFDQETVLGYCRGEKRSLREIIENFDNQFRRFMEGEVTDEDPRRDYLVSRNELRREESEAISFNYTEAHLATVHELFTRAGNVVAEAFNLRFCACEEKTTSDHRPALCLQFEDAADTGRKIRVFVVRLPYKFTSWIDGCIGLLHHLQTTRNFLWFVRCERIDSALEDRRPGQIFARALQVSQHNDLRALLHLLDKKDRYDPKQSMKAREVIAEVIKLTYLGEVLHKVQEVADHE